MCAAGCVLTRLHRAVTTSLAAVQHALSNYLKMALCRQRDAGNDAALDADSDVELDCDDQSSACCVDSLGS